MNDSNTAMCMNERATDISTDRAPDATQICFVCLFVSCARTVFLRAWQVTAEVGFPESIWAVMRTSQELNFRGMINRDMQNYSPFGPYRSKWTLTCSTVSPVFSFTPKLSKTSVADLVCAFSILVYWALDDQIEMHVVELHLLWQREGCAGGGGGRLKQQ